MSAAKRFDTHVYALVRVKVSATDGISDDPKVVAGEISTAVCTSPREWLSPGRTGTVRAGNGRAFQIEAVEFAESIEWVKVDERLANGELREHDFDGVGEPMAGMPPGAASAREGRLIRQIERLERELAQLRDEPGSNAARERPAGG